jgi:hypothetical protein
MLSREELRATRCWSCWWKEGGSCYRKDRTRKGDPAKGEKAYDVIGQPIDVAMAFECPTYWNKRAALGSVIPNDMLVICSEATQKPISNE